MKQDIGSDEIRILTLTDRSVPKWHLLVVVDSCGVVVVRKNFSMSTLEVSNRSENLPDLIFFKPSLEQHAMIILGYHKSIGPLELSTKLLEEEHRLVRVRVPAEVDS